MKRNKLKILKNKFFNLRYLNKKINKINKSLNFINWQFIYFEKVI